MRGFYAAKLLPIKVARYIFPGMESRQSKRIDFFLPVRTALELRFVGKLRNLLYSNTMHKDDNMRMTRRTRIHMPAAAAIGRRERPEAVSPDAQHPCSALLSLEFLLSEAQSILVKRDVVSARKKYPLSLSSLPLHEAAPSKLLDQDEKMGTALSGNRLGYQAPNVKNQGI